MTSFVDDNGNELDYDGNDFAISKQAISFYNFKIKADSSVNIKIPYTARNRKILNWLGDQQLSSSVRGVFNVYKNGNKENRGYIAIVSVDIEYFECFFISGNAGWFSLWDFNCNEITTSKYDIRLTDAGSSSWIGFTNTDGIIAPIVDYIFGGKMWNNNTLVPFLHEGDDSQAAYSAAGYLQVLPCLYLHTLLKLLANHSQTNISGDIFNDPFFKTIVITPETLEGWEYSSEVGSSLYNNLFKPEYIAPKIKAIELMKFVAVSFGCIVTFDNTANSISVDLMDRKEKSDSADWSQYYISHETEVSRYYEKYIISVPQSPQLNIKDYNISREQEYGELVLRSDKGDGSAVELYKSPFLPSYDVVGTTPAKWATPIVDYYHLEDDEQFAFSSATNAGGRVQFNGSGNYPWEVATSSSGLIIRVEAGTYAGFHWRDASGTDTNAEFLSGSTYVGNSSGNFWTQKMTRRNGHRILSVITSVPANTIQQYSTITLGGFGSPTMSTISTAYFSKKTDIYSTLNSRNQGLNYGEIDEDGRNDISLSEKYWNTYSKILKNPPVRVLMNLPIHVFATFNFGYVFLKTKELQGYFLVEKIENYIENKPCYVYLVKT